MNGAFQLMNRLAALTIVALAFACPARASDLMGPESCRACHAEAYKVWAAGPHARAALALSGGQQSNSPLCLYCHSRDEVRAGQAAVTGVSCETCHGGGRFYEPEIVMRDKELAHLFGLADLSGANAGPVCLSCHGGEQAQVAPFDLHAALKRIDHWSADRAARKTAQETPPPQQPDHQKPEAKPARPRLARAGAP